MIGIDRIYNEDCMEGMKRIPDGIVDLIVTDPPYEVAAPHDGGRMFADKRLGLYQEQLMESGLCGGYGIGDFSREVLRLQGGRVNAYFWCSKAQIPEYFRTYVEGLRCRFEIIAWHKQNALPTFSNKYLCDTEYCLYFHTGGFTRPASYEDARTYEVGSINHADKRKYGHPTIKPLHIIRRLIRNSSREGGTVLDPFIGSGTTAVAAAMENRHFIGFEINVKYYETACRRFRDETSQTSLFKQFEQQ